MSRLSEVEATALANEALTKVNGKGWEIKVWNNMGWRWCLRNGYMSVHPSGGPNGDRFHCLIGSEPGCGSGVGAWSTRGTHPTMNDAIEFELKSAEKWASKLALSVVTCRAVLAS